MDKKPKLSINNLIKHLSDKGVSFKYHSKEEIIDVLENKTYYYKLSSYRKNFPKTPDKKYINLDFKALVDLASIDTYFREIILDMSLDIEHMVKTKVMTDITYNDNEDGYHIVNDFKYHYPQKYNKMYQQFSYTEYKKDMFEKRQVLPIWVLMEITDFGTFTMISELYANTNSDIQKIIFSKQLKYIKNLRNASAHNNVFIINLFDRNSHIKHPDSQTKSYAQVMKIPKGLVYYYKTHDLINLFYLHKKLCSKELNKRRYNECLVLLNRMKKEDYLYSSAPKLQKFFRFMTFCVDFLDSK